MAGQGPDLRARACLCQPPLAAAATPTREGVRTCGAVREPGRYGITVTAPEGWRVTSGNARQSASFVRLAEAPVGIVAESSFTPVGVAPELTISGLVRVDAGTTPPRLRAVSPAGEALDVPVAATGTFSLVADAGDWQLTFSRGDQVVATRRVRVDAYPVELSTVVPGAVVPDARPVLHRADFDTLTSSDTLHEIQRGYAGLDWINWVASHQKLYGGPGIVNGTVSAEYFAYNSSGHPATLGSARPFDLVGLYLAVAWPRAEPHPVEIRAWRQDNLAYTDVLTGRTSGPVYFDADYRGVTRVEVRSRAYWQVVIDDLGFRTDETPVSSQAASTAAPASSTAVR